MLLRIDCVMFRVDDLDSALAFYRDVMGLVPRWREGNMAGLDFPRTPGTELVLHTDPDIPRCRRELSGRRRNGSAPGPRGSRLSRRHRPVPDRDRELCCPHRPIRQ
jgi:catechol 2,3-dioxygenase-like lactoylglutathione lyase family enzyme